MLNLKGGGEAQGLRSEATSHILQCQSVPSPAAPPTSWTTVLRMLYSLSTKQIRHPCVRAETEKHFINFDVYRK